MKGSERYRGLKKVFSFTLRQMFRNKSYRGVLITLFIMSLLSVPFMVLTSGGGFMNFDEGPDASVTKVWVVNGSRYAFEPAALASGRFEEVPFAAADALPADPETGIFPGEAWIVIDGRGKQVTVDVYGAEPRDGQALAELAQGAVQQAALDRSGLDNQTIADLSRQVSVDILTEAQYTDSRKVDFDVQYGVQMIYAIVVMMLSVYALSYIAQNLAEEKSSKLVEFLLISVRPGALVLGKVLACMIFVLCMMASMIAGMVISYTVSSQFLDTSTVAARLLLAGFSSQMFSFGLTVALVVVVSLVLSFATFSLLGGIFGATCSSMEDVQKAISIPMILVMGGYMVSIFGSIAESRTAAMVMSLIPVVSAFAAPVNYVCGNISFAVLALSWLIQAALLAGLAVFGGRVYEALLIHRGERVKLKELFSMAGRRERRAS